MAALSRVGFTKGGWSLVALLAALLGFAGAPFAGSSHAATSPWRLGFEAMGAYVSTTDQLDPRRDEHNLGDLTSRNRQKNRYEVLPMIDISYDHEPTSTQIYLATPYRSPALPLALGVNQRLVDGSVLDISISTEFDAEVWSNPYATEPDDRAETELEHVAGRVYWSSVRGTPFNVTVKAKNVSPKEDALSTQFANMNRDGQEFGFEMGYALMPGEGVDLTPSVSYVRGDYTGAAQCFNAYGTRARVTYRVGDVRVDASAGAVKRSYGDLNPYFGEARRELEVHGSALVTRSGLFGDERTYLSFLAAMSKREADIGFFDARTLMVGIGGGIRF